MTLSLWVKHHEYFTSGWDPIYLLYSDIYRLYKLLCRKYTTKCIQNWSSYVIAIHSFLVLLQFWTFCFCSARDSCLTLYTIGFWSLWLPKDIGEGVIPDPIILKDICYHIKLDVTCKNLEQNLKNWARLQDFNIVRSWDFGHNWEKNVFPFDMFLSI